MNLDAYHKSVSFLESLQNIPVKSHRPRADRDGIHYDGIGLARQKYLLKLLDDPQKNLKIVNVTGTSGKGSTCVMLASMLRQAGYKVGLFLSPHLTTTTERISVNGKMMHPDQFAESVEMMKPIVSSMITGSTYGMPTYFEILVGMALKYFSDAKCDYVILEAGLGGTYDGTNIADKQLCAVITNIGLDHTEILGRSVSKIARDKAGLLAEHGILISGEKLPVVRTLFKKVAKEKRGMLFEALKVPTIIRSDQNGTVFRLPTTNTKYFCRMVGEHHVSNATVAIQVARYLGLSERHIARGLKRVEFIGRSEVMQKHPVVMLDGAHNVDKIKAIVKTLKLYRYRKLVMIMTLLSDKDAPNIFKALASLKPTLVITRPPVSPRPVYDLTKLMQLAQKHHLKAELVIDPAEAWIKARKLATRRDLICVTGSLFLVGEIRKLWESEERFLKRRKLF